MKTFKWSLLYPQAWRKEFGDEFDAMLEMSGVTPGLVLDMVWHAMRQRCAVAMPSFPFFCTWLVVAWLNVFAHEVQWPAGTLFVSGLVLTLWRRERWFRNSLLLFSSIPISSICYYQIPGIQHEPIYKTAIALIPTFAGSCIGLLFGMGSPPPKEGYTQ